VPRTGTFSTAKIEVIANFTLSSTQAVAALPGYASANIIMNLFVTTVSGRVSPQRVSATVNGNFVARAFGGFGNNWLGQSAGVGVLLEQPRRFSEQYVLMASVESWAGTAGWARAEATVFPVSRVDNFTITCLE
jgi:hypothetical protein